MENQLTLAQLFKINGYEETAEITSTQTIRTESYTVIGQGRVSEVSKKTLNQATDLCIRTTKKRYRSKTSYSLQWDSVGCLGAYFLLRKKHSDSTASKLGGDIINALKSYLDPHWADCHQTRFVRHLQKFGRELEAMSEKEKEALERNAKELKISQEVSPFVSLITMIFSKSRPAMPAQDTVFIPAGVPTLAYQPRVFSEADTLTLAYMSVWNPGASVRQLVDKLCILAGRAVDDGEKDSLAEDWGQSLRDLMSQWPDYYQQVIDIASTCDGQNNLPHAYPSTFEWLGKLGTASF